MPHNAKAVRCQVESKKGGVGSGVHDVEKSLKYREKTPGLTPPRPRCRFARHPNIGKNGMVHAFELERGRLTDKRPPWEA